MSVDVSGKRFTVPREITASGNFLTVKFYVKDMPIPWSLYNRISWYSGTPNQLKYYREGDNTGVTVYSAGEWVSDAYYDIFSKITFATGTTLTDSEYEWLTSFAVEETLYLAEGDSLGKVANAIRDRSWTVGMYSFPDGFDAAIRAIGNYYIGGSISWNQLSEDSNRMTLTNYTTGSGTLAGTTANSIIGHVYLLLNVVTEFDTSETIAYRFYYNGSAHSYSTVAPDVIYKATTDTARIYYINFASAYHNKLINKMVLSPVVIDLTDAFGSEIADFLYALQQETPQAGTNKFKELFPDDYYPYQATPVLMSFKPGDWPVNAGVQLHGILTLDGEGWHRDADEYNNGVVLRKYAYPDMDNVGMDWRYNDTYDYFYTGDLYNSIGALKIDDTSPISFITDAYPTGGMILSTQGPADMTDGYIYQKSRNTSIGQGIILYVKDTSITSDHLNTFMAKIAGKKLVVKTATSSYYNP